MHLTIYFLALFFVPAFAAPIFPEPYHKIGDLVRVKPEHTGEKKGQTEKGVTIGHPAIVLSNPNPINGKIDVAQISHNLLHDTPRQNVQNFYRGAPAMPDGHVRLGTPKKVRQDLATPYLNKADGKPFPRVTGDNMERLKASIEENKDWHSPPSSPKLETKEPSRRSRSPESWRRPKAEHPNRSNSPESWRKASRPSSRTGRSKSRSKSPQSSWRARVHASSSSHTAQDEHSNKPTYIPPALRAKSGQSPTRYSGKGK